jgi:hypothetical protein
VREIDVIEVKTLAKVGLVLMLLSPAANAFGQADRVQSQDTTVAPITVTPAPKLSPSELSRAADGFVRARTTVTRIGRLARWREPVCPVTQGLPDELNAEITARVREIAAAVGAPVAREGCVANLEIEFTGRPQALIDVARKRNWILLGNQLAAQCVRATTMCHGIQSWYVTATRSYALGAAGGAFAAAGATGKGKVGTGSLGIDGGSAGEAVVDDPMGHSAGGEPGSRLDDTVSSEFANVLVIVDQARIAGASTPAIADYVAVLGLSQVSGLDDCSALPSILDMLSTGCSPARRPSSLTFSDFAYLKALYNRETRMEASYSRGAITSDVIQTLARR